MQLLAWGRMFAGYSETMTLSAALKETLDPSKPCEMCIGVAKAREVQNKHLPPVSEQDAVKFVLALHTPEKPVFVNDPGEWRDEASRTPAWRTDPVPLPPPRA